MYSYDAIPVRKQNQLYDCTCLLLSMWVVYCLFLREGIQLYGTKQDGLDIDHTDVIPTSVKRLQLTQIIRTPSHLCGIQSSPI
jgi:hypothetical protein